jgi:hypothetical protein
MLERIFDVVNVGRRQFTGRVVVAPTTCTSCNHG